MTNDELRNELKYEGCIESLSQQVEKKLVETINSILDLAASARDDDQKVGPDAVQAIWDLHRKVGKWKKDIRPIWQELQASVSQLSGHTDKEKLCEFAIPLWSDTAHRWLDGPGERVEGYEIEVRRELKRRPWRAYVRKLGVTTFGASRDEAISRERESALRALEERWAAW